MKKIFLIFSICILILMGGCSNTKELSYNGKQVVYQCTDEDVKLFKEEVIVNITDKQGFIMVDSNSEMNEYTNGLLEFTEEDEVDLQKCFFVTYEEVKNNNFASRTPISHRDPVNGGMRISISGNYSYKVKDRKTFVKEYTNIDDLNRYINTYINSVYVMNMPSKTYDELQNEKEFDQTKLNSVNSLLTKYGIEVTEVKIEKVEKLS